ncbi:MAG TPA: hypothetical protein VNT77_06215 [Allosphingosinicella sp.]|nr:hypothetical protein [Allosphingosinicella sp.]
MTMYVYHADGHPVGFLFSTFIHDLDGTPLGRILGSHVYRLDGVYVGEFHKETVVSKPVEAGARDIAPMRTPPRQPSPGISFSRRGLVNYGFPDVFHRLYEGAQQDDGILELAIAAE